MRPHWKNMAKQKAEKAEELEDDGVVLETTSGSDSAEEAEIMDIEDDLGTKLRQCKEKLALCQKERQEYLDGWQRSKADYLNQKRRQEDERQRENERYAVHFIGKLLPLCDSFDLALQDRHTEKDAKNEWRAGMEQTYQQLLGILKSYNVEMLEPKGEPFDPRLQEAVSEAPVTNEAQHHIISDVLQKGYRVGEQLIRPAKVVVGNYQTDAGANSKERN